MTQTKRRNLVTLKWLQSIERLKKDRDQLDRSCEKSEILQRSKEERNILHTIQQRKGNLIGHILHSNCLLSYVRQERQME